MGQQRWSFTPKFKQEAVDLCRRSGKSECQVARELGIPQPTFNRWMRKVAGAPLGSNIFLATEELKVLRREVEQLRMERDVLKKAVGIDTASIDYGQPTKFETHVALLSQNVPVFENLGDLRDLPDQGFDVIALPMKIAGGTGGPLRVIAVLPPSQ